MEALQKKAIRAITHLYYNAHSKPSFKDLQLLSLDDSFKYKVASLMWDFDHDNLPTAFSTLFSKRNNDHDHLTRMVTSDKLTITKTNTSKYGMQSFKILGAKLLNSLKNQDIYNNAKSKIDLLKKI